MEKQRQPSQADWSLFDVSSLGSRPQEKAEWELFGSNLRPRRRAWTLCARAWRARIEAGAWRSGRMQPEQRDGLERRFTHWVRSRQFDGVRAGPVRWLRRFASWLSSLRSGRRATDR